MRDPLSPLPTEIYSATMRSAIRALTSAAGTDAPIVLRGELGCEISELARFAHDQSGRRAHPFLTVACASLTELPVRNLSMSGRGTIFLHEIGELAEPLQAKLVHLLDALQAHGPSPRLISSTHRDLDTEVTEGRLRRDLLFRLNVVDIYVPPLRDRPEGILPAAQAFITLLSADLGRRKPTLSPSAATWLQGYPFPGNLRELRNLLERALLVSQGEVLEAEAFAGSQMSDLRAGADVTLRDLESEHVTRVLGRVGSLKKAATILGIDTSTLWRKRKRDEHGAVASSKPR